MSLVTWITDRRNVLMPIRMIVASSSPAAHHCLIMARRSRFCDFRCGLLKLFVGRATSVRGSSMGCTVLTTPRVSGAHTYGKHVEG